MTQVDLAEQARAFFENGWRGRLPWCVFEQVPCVRTAEEFDSVVRAASDGDGWMYGLCRDEVLHAPLFGIVASPQVQESIIEALAAWPAERGEQFEAWEREAYLKAGWPPSLVERVRPSGQLPTAENLPHPGLLVVRDDGGVLHMLGSFVGSGVFLPQALRGPGFVPTVDEAGHEVPADLATLIMLLISCPVPNKDPRPEWPLLIRPFFWKRLKELLLSRPELADRSKMAMLLLQQLPSVIASLRQRPPKGGMPSLRHTLRSRLVEAASEQVIPGRRRTGRRKWYEIRECDRGALAQARLSPREAELAMDLLADRSLTPSAWARRKGLDPATARTMAKRIREKLRLGS